MRLDLLVLLALPMLSLPVQAQWDLQDSRSTASLRGIHNLGGGVAWASGTSGTILRTEDGGYLWQTCATPPEAERLDFRGVQAFDENTAIVMSSGKGDLSRLYKTTDGCKSWKLVFTNPDKEGFWDAIQFSQESGRTQTGFVLGDPVDGRFVLYRTQDRGTTWVRIVTAPEAHLDGAFAASNSSLVLWGSLPRWIASGGTANYVYKSQRKSAGDNKFETEWVAGQTPLASGKDSTGGFSIAALVQSNKPGVGGNERDPKNLTGVVVGGDYKEPEEAARTAAYTNDGGKTWRPAQTTPHGFRSSVAYDEKTKTWISVGPNGTDISIDDGKNWRALHPHPGQPTDADKNWNALSLPFAVGPNGRIGKLRDDALKP